jgi:RNA polymerase sigma-70 factor (ECF subfamily)
MTDFTDRSTSQDEEFARLFARYHRVLFGYLMTSLGSPGDAEDVLQETCVILWREQDKFVPGTSFVNWAITIAQNQVRKFRRERQRQPLLPSDDLLDRIAEEGLSTTELQESRRSALNHCIERLTRSDRELVKGAYAGNGTIKALSEELGRPVNTVYKALNRIRLQLLTCIERQLAAEEHHG